MESSFYHIIFDFIITIASLGNTKIHLNPLGYPMWQSFSLLEVKKYEKALIQWLAYWIIYALLWKLEAFLCYLTLPLE